MDGMFVDERSRRSVDDSAMNGKGYTQQEFHEFYDDDGRERATANRVGGGDHADENATRHVAGAPQ